MNNNDISMPVIKASSAIGATMAAKADLAGSVASSVAASAGHDVWQRVNALPWDTMAQIGAAMYSLLLISEWFWKKLWCPVFERRGWIKPKRHRIISVEEYEAGNTGPAAL